MNKKQDASRIKAYRSANYYRWFFFHFYSSSLSSSVYTKDFLLLLLLLLPFLLLTSLELLPLKLKPAPESPSTELSIFSIKTLHWSANSSSPTPPLLNASLQGRNFSLLSFALTANSSKATTTKDVSWLTTWSIISSIRVSFISLDILQV